MDNSDGQASSGACVVLVSPKGHKLNSAVWFRFRATNNVAKYEALLSSLRLAKEMQEKRLLINSDSQLIVSQVNDNFTSHEKSMASYLRSVNDSFSSFKKFKLAQILRVENDRADTLSKLATSKDSKLLTMAQLSTLSNLPLPFRR